MHSGWMSGDWSQMSPWMGIGMLLFWGLLIYCVFTAVRMMTRKKEEHGPGEGETPVEVLKKRYANGEIDREEFERIKKDLE